MGDVNRINVNMPAKIDVSGEKNLDFEMFMTCLKLSID